MTPTTRLIQALGILSALALALGTLTALELDPPSWLYSLWWGLLLAGAAIALKDAWQVLRTPSPQITRTLPGKLPVGHWSEVHLAFSHAYEQPTSLRVFDHLPHGMRSEHLPYVLPLYPGEDTRFSYLLHPDHRGHFRFQRVEIQIASPLGLWRNRRLLPLAGETRVYPDFTRLHGSRLLAVDNWLSQLGVRQRPRRGLGQDFRQLRDFRDGDTLRQIDWKATARKRSPVVREYQDERDQRILFLLDCGRRMRSQDGELSHFDHALEACLLLSHVALRQGDAVGIATFASETPRFLAPGKGPEQLNALLNTLYDLQSTRRPADYTTAVQDLLLKENRRALVVVVTNLRDEDDSELPAALNQLGRRHRVLLVSLREEVLDAISTRPVERFDEALEYCGAVDYLGARAQLHRKLTALGVPVLDARPGELGPRMIERYLEMKKAGTL